MTVKRAYISSTQHAVFRCEASPSCICIYMQVRGAPWRLHRAPPAWQERHQHQDRERYEGHVGQQHGLVRGHRAGISDLQQ